MLPGGHSLAEEDGNGGAASAGVNPIKLERFCSGISGLLGDQKTLKSSAASAHLNLLGGFFTGQSSFPACSACCLPHRLHAQMSAAARLKQGDRLQSKRRKPATQAAASLSFSTQRAILMVPTSAVENVG